METLVHFLCGGDPMGEQAKSNMISTGGTAIRMFGLYVGGCECGMAGARVDGRALFPFISELGRILGREEAMWFICGVIVRSEGIGLDWTVLN
jgi:hypothetical protein